MNGLGCVLLVLPKHQIESILLDHDDQVSVVASQMTEDGWLLILEGDESEVYKVIRDLLECEYDTTRVDV